MNRNPDNWQWPSALGAGAASRKCETRNGAPDDGAAEVRNGASAVRDEGTAVRNEGPLKVPPRTGEPSAEEVDEMVRRLCQSNRRSTFAQNVFPYIPGKYKSESEWRKRAGTRVSNDIHTHPELKAAMYSAGYIPHMVGYDEKQLRILVRFYMLQGVIGRN